MLLKPAFIVAKNPVGGLGVCTSTGVPLGVAPRVALPEDTSWAKGWLWGRLMLLMLKGWLRLAVGGWRWVDGVSGCLYPAALATLYQSRYLTLVN